MVEVDKRERIAVFADDPQFYQRVRTALSTVVDRMSILLLPIKPPISPKGTGYVIAPEGREVKGIPKVLVVKDGDTSEEISINFLRLLMMGKRYQEVTIGIDPGERIGVCIIGDGGRLWDGLIFSPREVIDLLTPLRRVVESRLYLIRIGNGAPLYRDEIINGLIDLFPLEMVDEEKLPRSDNDVESAYLIAITPGYRMREKVEHRISKGEITKIQEESRKVTGRITISKELAEKVARGEMTLEKAIELMSGC